MNSALIRPAWSPVSIALMVLGFIVFWPLGLAVLAYILWGEYAGGSKDKAEAWMKRTGEGFKGCGAGRGRHGGHKGFASTGNAAFDDYREEQLKRLDEERRRLDEELDAFEEHLKNLRKARDREEFDRFMRERNGGGNHGGFNDTRSY